MKNNGFTLIELIAVVVIIAIIALIATPNIVSMVDTGKKEDYLADAKEFISKATYMYKQETYKNDDQIFSNSGRIWTIKLKDIKNISDFNDPYGGTYNDNNSYVRFIEPEANSLNTRTVSIYLESCDEDNSNCYHIEKDGGPVNETDLSTESIVKIE